MPYILEQTRSCCLALYSFNPVTSKLSLKHSIGYGKNIYGDFDLSLGEGFIGHMALQEGTTLVQEIPADVTFTVRTFLGEVKPKNVLIAPALYQGRLYAVLVLSSIYGYTSEEVAFVDSLRQFLATTMESGREAEKNARIAKEADFQYKMLYSQYEEMRSGFYNMELLSYCLLNTLSNNIVFILDIGYKVLAWSERAKKLYGLSRGEASGRHIDQLHKDVNKPLIGDALRAVPDKGCLELIGLEFYWLYDPAHTKPIALAAKE